MILIDTSVLVALVDERDALHVRAKRDLRRLKGPFAIPSAVLVESGVLLDAEHERRRLAALLDALRMQPIEPSVPFWAELFEWLLRYSDHDPDVCDAVLVLLAFRHSLAIWTYDREFRKVWRRPDGKALKLVPSARHG